MDKMGNLLDKKKFKKAQYRQTTKQDKKNKLKLEILKLKHQAV